MSEFTQRDGGSEALRVTPTPLPLESAVSLAVRCPAGHTWFSMPWTFKEGPPTCSACGEKAHESFLAGLRLRLACVKGHESFGSVLLGDTCLHEGCRYARDERGEPYHLCRLLGFAEEQAPPEAPKVDDDPGIRALVEIAARAAGIPFQARPTRICRPEQEKVVPVGEMAKAASERFAPVPVTSVLPLTLVCRVGHTWRAKPWVERPSGPECPVCRDGSHAAGSVRICARLSCPDGHEVERSDALGKPCPHEGCPHALDRIVGPGTTPEEERQIAEARTARVEKARQVLRDAEEDEAMKKEVQSAMNDAKPPEPSKAAPAGEMAKALVGGSDEPATVEPPAKAEVAEAERMRKMVEAQTAARAAGKPFLLLPSRFYHPEQEKATPTGEMAKAFVGGSDEPATVEPSTKDSRRLPVSSTVSLPVVCPNGHVWEASWSADDALFCPVCSELSQHRHAELSEPVGDPLLCPVCRSRAVETVFDRTQEFTLKCCGPGDGTHVAPLGAPCPECGKPMLSIVSYASTNAPKPHLDSAAPTYGPSEPWWRCSCDPPRGGNPVFQQPPTYARCPWCLGKNDNLTLFGEPSEPEAPGVPTAGVGWSGSGRRYWECPLCHVYLDALVVKEGSPPKILHEDRIVCPVCGCGDLNTVEADFRLAEQATVLAGVVETSHGKRLGVLLKEAKASLLENGLFSAAEGEFDENEPSWPGDLAAAVLAAAMLVKEGGSGPCREP